MENSYYLYRHIREDKNEPFYIGIGTVQCSGNAYSRSKDTYSKNNIWKKIVDKTSYHIEIMIESDSDDYIQEKEREFIKLYGRICENNGGILANIESGGRKGYDHPSVRKKLYCCNNNKWYTSISEASNDLNIERSTISRALKGETMSASGFVFKHSEDCEHCMEKGWKPIIDEKYGYYLNENKQVKKVVKIEENGIIIALKEHYIKPVKRDNGNVQMTIAYKNTKITVNLKKEYFKIFGKEW